MPTRAPRHRIPRVQLAPILVLAGLVGLGIGCSNRPVLRTPGDPVAAATKPVLRDLGQIRAGGTLRVLTNNSSSSYYVLRGEEYGFEYELARRVSRDLELNLQIVLPDSSADPFEMLRTGKVDVIAMPLQAADVRERSVAWTVPYQYVQQRLVVHQDQVDQIRRLADLDGLRIAAREFSGGARELDRLRSLGVDLTAVLYGSGVPEEEILDLVADGTYPAAIALDVEVSAARRFREELRQGVALGPRHEARWATRSNASRLLRALDESLSRQIHRGPDGEFVRSKFYNVVHARYFDDDSRMEEHHNDPFLFARTGRVSPYDDLFHDAGRRWNFDWRLLAALAFQESRFDPTASSWAGAHGLMQLLPRTAGVSAKALEDPQVNVPLGARHLRILYDRYRAVPEPDRTRFALAAYNCGQGHLDDARTLSVMLGEDPDKWVGSVRESLLLLRQPHYYQMVRYGYVRGHETVAYVREIEERFALLRTLAPDRERTTAQVTRSTPSRAAATHSVVGAAGLD